MLLNIKVEKVNYLIRAIRKKKTKIEIRKLDLFLKIKYYAVYFCRKNLVSIEIYLLNFGKQSPNLLSKPANVTVASLYPPM